MKGFTILYLTIVVLEVVYAINDDVKPINMFLRPEPLKPRWRRSLLGPMPYGYFHSPIEPWAEEMNHVPDSNVDSYRHPVWAFRQPLPAIQKPYQNNFKSLFEHAGPFEKEMATPDVSSDLTPENDINKLLALHMANIHGSEYKQQQKVLPDDNISVQLLANVYHHYPALPTVEPTVVYELNMPIVVVHESKKNEEAPFKPSIAWFYTTPRQDIKDVETIVPVTESITTTKATISPEFSDIITTKQTQEITTESYSVFVDELEKSSPTESSWISSNEEKTSSYNSNTKFDAKVFHSEEEKIENYTPPTNEVVEIEGTTESLIGEIVDNISQEFPSDAHNVITNVWDVDYV
ncbi:uncharacterized protein LOC126896217 isoform X2 [Daktulosphaira vitifoliae]|uniref:uncharacterized protein LOC126896217 isoform X2 n=1 Tax=Daktulosphaira vitifoliae TaxID=58002 RepID=UPI0021AAF763|nr:uncharacterized protein LOC126896217 isoform X2 [Daktulosphaira vitifoliae]